MDGARWFFFRLCFLLFVVAGCDFIRVDKTPRPMEAVPIPLEAESEGSQPAYWYHDYWLHCIGWEGPERSLKQHRRRVPCIERDAFKIRKKGDTVLFYWQMIYSVGDSNGPVPTINILGKALFGKVERNSTEYKPVVHVIQTRANPRTFGLFASRNFCMGDAIVFIPEFEEESGECILGGAFARVVDSPSDCNSYITRNRTLRCVKDIRAGEEIIRCEVGTQVLEEIENIDRVVLSMESMSVGKLGLKLVQGDPDTLVHFDDNRIEVVRNFHLHVYRNNTVGT